MMFIFFSCKENKTTEGITIKNYNTTDYSIQNINYQINIDKYLGFWINENYANSLTKTLSPYTAISDIESNLISILIGEEESGLILLMDYITEKIEIKIDSSNDNLIGCFSENDCYRLSLDNGILKISSKVFNERFIKFDPKRNIISIEDNNNFYNNKILFNEKNLTIFNVNEQNIFFENVIFKNDGSLVGFKPYKKYYFQYDFVVDPDLYDKLYLFDEYDNLRMFNYKFEDKNIYLYDIDKESLEIDSIAIYKLCCL